jgi:hypothetical protein
MSTTIATLGALALGALTIGGAAAEPDLAALTPSDLRGCIAATESGERVACVHHMGGRAQLEVKEVKSRRVYRIEMLGSEKLPNDAAATPPKKVAGIAKWLEKNGYRGLSMGARRAADGAITVPGLSCALRVRADHKYIETVANGESKPWLEVGGPGGKASLTDVSVLDAGGAGKGTLFLLLSHVTMDAEGPIESEQLKVVPISELRERPQCTAPQAVPQ